MFRKLSLIIIVFVTALSLAVPVSSAQAATRWVNVTSPNGGETLTVGNVFPITWTSSSNIDKVSIGYKTCSGCPVTWIVTNISNGGSYNWTVNVGNTSKTKFLIHIIGYQTGSGSDTDTSNSYFNVVKPPTPTRTTTSTKTPTPSRTPTKTATTSITPTATATSTATNTATATQTATETFTPTATQTATETFTPTFTSTPEPAITLLTPNGGEVFTSGDTVLITWDSSPNITTVAIAWHACNGDCGDWIETGIPNTGSYEWTALEIVDGQPLELTIDVIGFTIDGVHVTDTSDATFSVLPIPTATPTDTATFTATNTATFTATITNTPTPTSTRTPTATRTVTRTITPSVTPSLTRTPTATRTITATRTQTATFTSTVTSTPTMTVTPTASFTPTVTVTNTPFPPTSTVSPTSTALPPASLTVLSPNGGEVFISGDVVEITWDASPSIEFVSIAWHACPGNCGDWIAIDVPNTGSYEWTVIETGYEPELLLTIQIVGFDTQGVLYVDDSDAQFTVLPNSYTATPTPYPGDSFITVTSPNGGEVFFSGDLIDITWDTSPNIEFVSIAWHACPGNCGDWIAIDIPNTGSYQWTAPHTGDEPEMLLTIQIVGFDTQGVLSVDDSDAQFTVLPDLYTPTPTPYPGESFITVISPNGGESLNYGEPYQITWDSSPEIDAVQILIAYVYTCEGCPPDPGLEYWTNFVPNTGSYEWDVYVSDPENKQFNVLIYGLISDGQGDYFYADGWDESDGPFNVLLNGMSTYTPGPPTATETPTPISTPGLFEPYTIYGASDGDATGIGDFNNDGLNDVALSYPGQLLIFLQEPDGTLADPVFYAGGARPEALAVGDLNNDGLADIVTTNVSSDTISVFLQQPDGTMAPRVTHITHDAPNSVAVGDINSDGLEDVAVSPGNSTSINIFTQNTGGTLNSLITYASPDAGFDDIAIGDVNNDGLNDVVKMNGQGSANPNLSVYIQNPSGTLAAAVSYDLPCNCNSNGLGLGDVTGDGLVDVVLSYGGNRPSSNIAVLPQGSDGTLQAAISYAAYDIPEPVEIADVNSDGLLDVVVAHGGWQTVSVYLQQADGTLGTYQRFTVPYASHYEPQGLAVGDINNDGLPDVTLADYNHGLVVLYQTGGYTYTPTPTAPFTETSTPPMTDTPTPFYTEEPTWTPLPTESPTPELSPTATQPPTHTPTPVHTATLTPTRTITPTPTRTRTPTISIDG